MKKVNRNNMIYYSSREQFDFSIFKIINLLVMIFIAAKLQYTKLIKNKMI